MEVLKEMKKLHVKTGDTVEVISGQDKGKQGKVLEVSATEGKVIVEGINMVKKAVKPRTAEEKGGIIEVPAPMYASKVMLVCPKCGKKTRVGYKIFEDGTKQRVCKHANCSETF